MDKLKMISAQEFCAINHIEFSFIESLQETGLIEMITIEDRGFIPVSQIQELERMIRLYYDLQINLEGIDAINHLLQRITDLQEEVRRLSNRLRMFENDPFQ